MKVIVFGLLFAGMIAQFEFFTLKNAVAAGGDDRLTLKSCVKFMDDYADAVDSKILRIIIRKKMKSDEEFAALPKKKQKLVVSLITAAISSYIKEDANNCPAYVKAGYTKDRLKSDLEAKMQNQMLEKMAEDFGNLDFLLESSNCVPSGSASSSSKSSADGSDKGI